MGEREGEFILFGSGSINIEAILKIVVYRLKKIFFGSRGSKSHENLSKGAF